MTGSDRTKRVLPPLIVAAVAACAAAGCGEKDEPEVTTPSVPTATQPTVPTTTAPATPTTPTQPAP